MQAGESAKDGLDPRTDARECISMPMLESEISQSQSQSQSLVGVGAGWCRSGAGALELAGAKESKMKNRQRRGTERQTNTLNDKPTHTRTHGTPPHDRALLAASSTAPQGPPPFDLGCFCSPIWSYLDSSSNPGVSTTTSKVITKSDYVKSRHFYSRSKFRHRTIAIINNLGIFAVLVIQNFVTRTIAIIN